jgi:hexosaminidase
VPRPRRLVAMGGRAHVDPALAAEHVDPAAELGEGIDGPEAYRLRISQAVQAPVVIEARSEAGVRHARATLTQLMRQYADRGGIPCMVIEDAPRFAARGYMLDISRDRVPTMDHLLEIVDLLASLKYNHLQLYTEHTFAYAGHEEVWEEASPMTPAEVRELDVYCRQRGIEMAANQNCFGHLARWLRLARYAPLAETHGEWDFEVAGGDGMCRIRRCGPFSLCPLDPGSLALIEDLLGQLLPCFSSPLVNIGCDETFDIGFGRSAEAVRDRGRAAVYFDFVNAVAEIARRQGRRSMFWADIALGHPDAAAHISEDMLPLAWGYEPDTPWMRWLELLSRTGSAAWVCPGTSTWRSITGRTTERRINIAEAAREGLAGGAAGFLLTDWGDMGHHQVWPLSLTPIAQAAQAAWSGQAEPDPRAVSVHVFNDFSLRAAAWMEALGDADLPLRQVCGRPHRGAEPRPLRNASALFTDLHTLLNPGDGDDPEAREGLLASPVAAWEAVEERLAEHAAKLPRDLAAQDEDEIRHMLRLAQFAARRAILRRRRESISAAIRHQLAEELHEIKVEHERLWLGRSRCGGLVASAHHYRRITKELRA